MKKRFLTSRIPYILERCRGKSVLDIGCAHNDAKHIDNKGWLHREIDKVAKSLVGLDIEADAVKYMNELGYTTFVADAQNFDLTDKYPDGFDVIVCGDVIEHLTNPGDLIKSAMKHLAPNGKVIMSTVNELGFLYIVETALLGNETLDDDHTMAFSRKQIHKFMEKCNCRITDFYYTNEVGNNRHEWYAKYLYRPIWLVQCAVSFICPSLSKCMIFTVTQNGA